MYPRCPFCLCGKYSASVLPQTKFNNKTFSYIRCEDCQLVYVDPVPEEEDFGLMYQPSYHYGVNKEIFLKDRKPEGLRFPYKMHFDLIKKYGSGAAILDYGCGQGNFIVNALASGFCCDGVEYNAEHIGLLKSEIPLGNFFLPDNFFNNSKGAYDVIRLSNVLEHIPYPAEIIRQLKKKLKKDGILIIEGPVEMNFSFSFLVKNSYFIFKNIVRNKPATHAPTHLFFSDAANQRFFFKKLGMMELAFQISENSWPFPEKWKDAKGIAGVVKFFVGQLSKQGCYLNTNWGNTFIYVGITGP